MIKEHLEFFSLDLSSGWQVPEGYPEGIEQKILGGSLDETNKKVIWLITFTSSIQVSGVRFQQPKSTHCVGVAHEIDFFPPGLTFSCNQISVQDSGVDIY